MRTPLKLLCTLGMLATAFPAKAHHQPAKTLQGYSVYWKGMPMKPGVSQSDPTFAPDFWKNAFVSMIKTAATDQTVFAAPKGSVR